MAGVEHGVAGFAQRGVDDPAVIGVELGTQPVAAIIIEQQRTTAARPFHRRRRRRASGAGRAPRTIVANWATVANGATSANTVEMSRGLGRHRRLIDRQPTLGEGGHDQRMGGPGLGQADDLAGPPRRQAGLPTQPVGQRPDPPPRPGVGGDGLGGQLDERRGAR